MKKSRLLVLFLALMMVFTLVGCSSSPSSDSGNETPAEEPSAEISEAINVALTTSPVGMHPLKTNDAPSTYVNGQMFETLYRRTVDGTSYVPLLAAELPAFEGNSATIKLREGVTFHDGTPFTAEAVAYMIDCLKNPDYGSQRPSIVESIESYEIVDDHTIKLNLAYEDGVLVAKLAHTNGCIVNPALDQSQDLLVDPTGAGTGPYKFVSSVPGSNYVLTANENYWNGVPSVKDVNFDVVPDENTAISRLKTGEADFIPTILADSFNEASAIDGYTAVSVPSSAVMYLAMRANEDVCLNPIMANADFRKAVLEALDLPTYVDAMMGVHASYIKSIVGPTLVGYTSAMDEYCYSYNIEDAKSIIDSNGWAGQEITMLIPTRGNQQNLAAYMFDQLSQIGIKLNIIEEEWGTFLDSAKKDKYFDITVLTWSNVTGDGQQMLEPNFSSKNGVRLKWNNAEFDAAVDASAKTSVLADREAAMLEAVKLIQGGAIVAPVFSDNTRFVYNSTKLSGVELDKGGQFYINDFVINN